MIPIRIVSIGVIIVFLSCFAACHRNPADINLDQATEIAQNYFSETYNMDVSVLEVAKKRVDEDKNLNFITLSFGESEYTLILDERNKPLSDNVYAMKRMGSVNMALLDEELVPLGLQRQISESNNGLRISHQNVRYQFSLNLEVTTEECPNREMAEGILSLLRLLNREGIDKLAIQVTSPDFLLLHHYGVQLDGKSFFTDISASDFEEQYGDFADRNYWDRKKFEKITVELSQLGYENVCFYINDMTISSIEIALYCESYNTPSDDQVASILRKLDDVHFKTGAKEVNYTLQHVIIY